MGIYKHFQTINWNPAHTVNRNNQQWGVMYVTVEKIQWKHLFSISRSPYGPTLDKQLQNGSLDLQSPQCQREYIGLPEITSLTKISAVRQARITKVPMFVFLYIFLTCLANNCEMKTHIRVCPTKGNYTSRFSSASGKSTIILTWSVIEGLPAIH